MDLEKYTEAIKILPERDQHILRDYYELGYSQIDIARRYGLTQGSISYNLKRISDRLNYIAQYDIPDNLEEVLADYCGRVDYHMIMGLIGTTSQTAAAEHVNNLLGLKGTRKLSQIRVRNLFRAFLRRCRHLARYDPRIPAVQTYLTNLIDNWLILQRPRRGKCSD